jgi:hypothetical protein
VIERLPTVLKRTEHLASAVNDSARKISVRGRQAVVPLKFDADGEIVNETTPPTKLVLKRLTLKDLEFLKAWRESEWNLEKARGKVSIDDSDIERVVHKLQCFREEDAKIKALAEIPTATWIAAKHVENVYEGGRLEESEHKSLQELAKIQGAYKQQAPTTQVNVFNLPDLPPEQAAKIKEVFDTIALKEDTGAAA